MKITLLDHGPRDIPDYASKGAAGIDIEASIKEPIRVEPGERILIPSGFKIELPINYEAQIRPRSGLAIKHGITVLNSPGTIDSDYRGEVGVILINHSDKNYVIEPRTRVAQMVICSWPKTDLVKVNILSNTGRGTGGFGSLGNNNG